MERCVFRRSKAVFIDRHVSAKNLFSGVEWKARGSCRTQNEITINFRPVGVPTVATTYIYRDKTGKKYTWGSWQFSRHSN